MGETVIGSNCFLMVNSHVGHNCVLGDGVIVANGALIAGHVTVGDKAFISGNCLMHQFVRVGTLALLRGGGDQSGFAAVHSGGERGERDVRIEYGGFAAGGIRAGATAGVEEGLPVVVSQRAIILREAVALAQKEFTAGPARVMLDFVASTKRGICYDVGQERGENEAE